MNNKYEKGLISFAIEESLNTMYKNLFTQYRYGQEGFDKEDARLYLIKTKRFFIEGKKHINEAIEEINEGIKKYDSVLSEKSEV